jgi:serine/threonine protein kinase
MSKVRPTVVGGHTFTVDPSRYDLEGCRILGRGSYGVVTTAIDKLQDNLKIAIKRIRPFANDEWDARHTLREIRLLRLLGPHPNVSFTTLCINILYMFN